MARRARRGRTHAAARFTASPLAAASAVFAPRAMPAPATAMPGPNTPAASMSAWLRRVCGTAFAARLGGLALRYLRAGGPRAAHVLAWRRRARARCMRAWPQAGGRRRRAAAARRRAHHEVSAAALAQSAVPRPAPHSDQAASATAALSCGVYAARTANAAPRTAARGRGGGVRGGVSWGRLRRARARAPRQRGSSNSAARARAPLARRGRPVARHATLLAPRPASHLRRRPKAGRTRDTARRQTLRAPPARTPGRSRPRLRMRLVGSFLRAVESG